jgi:hypothetical protein
VGVLVVVLLDLIQLLLVLLQQLLGEVLRVEGLELRLLRLAVVAPVPPFLQLGANLGPML